MGNPILEVVERWLCAEDGELPRWNLAPQLRSLSLTVRSKMQLTKVCGNGTMRSSRSCKILVEEGYRDAARPKTLFKHAC